MIPSEKAAHKIVFFVLYVCIAAFTIWGGIRVINYSLESKFYKDFLAKWEISLMAYAAEGKKWPHFTGGNHVEYMENLVLMMQRNSLTLPKSDNRYPYIYRINKIGWNKEENTFLLCFSDKIIIYGISKDTFKRIDTLIDGMFDRNHGKFTGFPSKDGKTYISRWQI